MEHIKKVYRIPGFNKFSKIRHMLYDHKNLKFYTIDCFKRKGMYFSGQNVINSNKNDIKSHFLTSRWQPLHN